MAEQHKLITAEKFHQVLVDAGVVRNGENIFRLVIDAKAGHLVTVYIERAADERLLDVIPTLDGIEVKHG